MQNLQPDAEFWLQKLFLKQTRIEKGVLEEKFLAFQFLVSHLVFSVEAALDQKCSSLLFSWVESLEQ
jgi:hypothetical protein